MTTIVRVNCLILIYFFIWTVSPVQAQIANVSSGKLVRIDSFPSVFVPARNIDIWLPPGYSPHKKYSVLYMHDGQMLFDSTNNWNHSEWQVDEMMTQLLQEKIIRKCIVVGIWNSGPLRHSDYCPEKPLQFLTADEKRFIYNSTRGSGNKVFADTVYSDKYLQFIVKELKPFVDKNYSVYKDPAHTLIAGSSMGGLISLYAMCEYPGVFGAAACMSTHWTGIFSMFDNPFPEAMFRYLETHLPDAKNHRIYFDHGTATLDSMYGAYQPLIDRMFRKAGYGNKNLESIVFPGENHSEKAWAARLDKPLVFLLGK